VPVTPSPTAEPTAVASPSPVEESATVLPTSTATPGPLRVRVAETAGLGANLRQEPGTQERVLKTLPEGTELTIVGPDRDVEGRTWRNVRDPTDTIGWIVAEVLQPSEAEAEVPTPAAPTPGLTPTPAPPSPEAAMPCQEGQIKGDAVSGLYYLPSHPQYGAIRERVRCFDTEAQPRASGFRPAP
jgi:hypothetical protein